MIWSYLDYYKKKLRIEISLYNICLFIIKDGGENFGIARFQIINIVNIEIETFMKKEETKIIDFKFKIKTWTILDAGVLKDFNNCHIIIEAKFNMVI